MILEGLVTSFLVLLLVVVLVGAAILHREIKSVWPLRTPRHRRRS